MSAKVTAYVGHYDCSRHDTGWRHPEHQGRLPAVSQLVYRDMLTLFDPLLELEATPASEADLRLAHTAEHVARVRQWSRDAAEGGTVLEVAPGTMVSGASWEAVLAAVGTALAAVDAVLEGRVRNAFGATRPPGHGAGLDSAAGYSLVNQVAVAALHLRERHALERVLVLEVGSRPGLGTAEILAGRDGVRFVSLHQASPEGTAALQASGAFALPLEPGADGATALRVLRQGLDRTLDGFVPQFILLSLGCDALATDPLGGLALTPLDYHALTVEVRERAEAACGGRLVSLLEEGYDAQATGRAVVQHLRALAGLPPQ